MDTDHSASSRTSVASTQKYGMSQVSLGTSEAPAPSVTAPTEVIDSPLAPLNGNAVLAHSSSASSHLSQQPQDVMHIGSWAPTEGQLDISRHEDIPQSIITASAKFDGRSSIQTRGTSALDGEGDVQKRSQAAGLLKASLHRQN